MNIVLLLLLLLLLLLFWNQRAPKIRPASEKVLATLISGVFAQATIWISSSYGEISNFSVSFSTFVSSVHSLIIICIRAEKLYS